MKNTRYNSVHFFATCTEHKLVTKLEWDHFARFLTPDLVAALFKVKVINSVICSARLQIETTHVHALSK